MGSPVCHRLTRYVLMLTYLDRFVAFIDLFLLVLANLFMKPRRKRVILIFSYSLLTASVSAAT